MNRPGVGPQSLRGLPSGFASQQQSQQQQMSQTRSVSSRLPPGVGAGAGAGKMGTAGNGTSSWAFGGGSASAGMTPGPRPGQPLASSFAQTIGASQPATPLDMSEFPSLSNNQSIPSQSTWATSGQRPMAPASNLRHQSNAGLTSQAQLSSQPQNQQQDDAYSSTSQLPGGQSNFRFGAQGAVSQSSSAGPADDFPPLSRGANGDVGQDRAPSSLQNVGGFGMALNGLGFGSGAAPQPSRGNGLLNALSSSSRMNQGNRMPLPVGNAGSTGAGRGAPDGSQALSGINDGESRAVPGSQAPPRNSISGLNGHVPESLLRSENGPAAEDRLLPKAASHDKDSDPSQVMMDEDGHVVEDPLAHMKDIDKWGLKGFTFMMNNYPDYAACVTGQDVNSFGLDLSSPDLISTQIYSLLDNEPPRPAPIKHKLPECYQVHNVAPLDSKINNLNDEALMFMFYSNPHDISQVLAAQELHNRNWRYHKKLKLWLTKDDLMVPQSLGNGQERGYYIFFDVKQWHKEWREFTLIYDDLESLPATNRGPIA